MQRLLPTWITSSAIVLAVISWIPISYGIVYITDFVASDLSEAAITGFIVFIFWILCLTGSIRFLSRRLSTRTSETSIPLLYNDEVSVAVSTIPWISSCSAAVAILVNSMFVAYEVTFLDESALNLSYQKISLTIRFFLTVGLLICSPSSKLKQGVIVTVILNQLLLILDVCILHDTSVFYILMSFANSTCFAFTRTSQLVSWVKRDGFDGSTLFTMYTFWWVYPTLLKAKATGKLGTNDFPSLSSSDHPNFLMRKFNALYITSSVHSFMSRAVQLLVVTAYSVQKSVFISSYVNGIVFLCCMFTDPILLSALLSQPSSHTSWILMVALSVSMFVRVSCMEVCFFLSTRVANNVRTIICQALFSASIRSKNSVDKAKLSNLMATDADKLGQWSWGVFFLAQWTWAIVSLPFVLWFLRKVIGNGALIGVCCLLSSGLVSWGIGKYLSVLELGLQRCRDERARCLRSFLSSVKIMKLENLQSVWTNQMEHTRRKELKQLSKIRYVSAVSDFLCSLISLSVPVSMFTWRVCVEELPLTTEVAFVSLAWIAQMQWSISTLPAIYQAWSSLQPSFDRLAAELQTTSAVPPLESRNNVTIPDEILKGLVVIVGPTGSGKSTLLASLASKKCACFVRQRPFLMNGTISENISFGLDLNEERLQDAIERTNLDQDILALPNGVQTQIGPNGVQLSGGQKVRVGLARAVYSGSDLMLLDDIFSAVDRTTGSHIWKYVICHFKQLGKTVILVTHELRFLSSPLVDHVVLLCDGQIVASSPFSAFDKNILEQYSKHLTESETRQESPIAGKSLPAFKSAVSDNEGLSLKETYRFLENLLKLLKGKIIDDSLIYDHILLHLRPDSAHSEHSLTSKGAISFSDLFIYLREFGWFFLPVIVLAVCEAASSVLSNVWLSIWSGASNINDNQSQRSFLLIYFLIGVFYLVLVFFQALVRAKFSLIVSSIIHQQMASRLVEDLSNIDGSVPNSLFGQISKSLNLFVQFMLIALYAPFVFAILPLMIFIYTSIFQIIRTPARDTRRIEAEARSPVYQLFNDILEGREVIQCANAESRFESMNCNKVHEMAVAKYGNEAVIKWAQAITTQSSCILYLLTGCISLLLINRRQMNLGQLGLVLYYAASIQRGMMEYLMGLTSVETNFVSVERIGQILRIPVELGPTEVRVDHDVCRWPTQGDLSLQNVALRYALNRPEALKGMTIDFPSGIKVAVIGRTGCGKSSLVSVLSSLYPISKGSIILDGIRLSQVPLSVARQVVRVIPQDPILFTGTIRSNIAINKFVPDDVIWSILEQTNLAPLIRRLGGLDAELLNEGTNLSAGERQLLCMARAFVMGIPKILLCDEPTSNIDRYTGTIITDLLLKLEITVLMVMHRLESLHKFDRVLLLENGRIAAYGDTKQLMSDHTSAVRMFADRQHV